MYAQQYHGAVRRERVNSVALGDEVNDGMRALVVARGNVHVRSEQRLRVHLVIERNARDLSKRSTRDGGRRQLLFVGVPARSVVVVVIGGDRDLPSGKRRKQTTTEDQTENDAHTPPGMSMLNRDANEPAG